MKYFFLIPVFSFFFFSCNCKFKDKKNDFAIQPVFLNGYTVQNLSKNSAGKTIMLFRNQKEFDVFLTSNDDKDELIKPDFDKNYVLMITHNPDIREIQIAINKIENLNNQINVYYGFCKTPGIRNVKTRALSLFMLPKDSSVNNIGLIGEIDTILLDTRYQNLPPVQWEYVYEGVFPCADCPGIDATLKISPDFQEYEYTRFFMGQQPISVKRGKMLVEHGYKKDKDALIFWMNPGDEKEQRYFLQPSDRRDAVILLSPQREFIDSDLNYVLVRKQ